MTRPVRLNLLPLGIIAYLLIPTLVVVDAVPHQTNQVEGPYGLPLVPVAAMMLPPEGKLLAWSARQNDTYTNGGGATSTALFDPNNAQDDNALLSFVQHTGHDMFCPVGTENLFRF